MPATKTQTLSDHILLSPSGKISKVARKRANERERKRLFPDGFWDKPKESEADKRKREIKSLRRNAKQLREIAARGMCVRSYPKEAARLEAEADKLENVVNNEEE